MAEVNKGVGVSLNPDSMVTSTPTADHLITRDQARYLVAKCIEERISEGRDERKVEDWLGEEFGYHVGDVSELTKWQFQVVMAYLEGE
jgi:hypothetical protein